MFVLIIMFYELTCIQNHVFPGFYFQCSYVIRIYFNIHLVIRINNNLILYYCPLGNNDHIISMHHQGKTKQMYIFIIKPP